MESFKRNNHLPFHSSLLKKFFLARVCFNHSPTPPPIGWGARHCWMLWRERGTIVRSGFFLMGLSLDCKSILWSRNLISFFIFRDLRSFPQQRPINLEFCSNYKPKVWQRISVQKYLYCKTSCVEQSKCGIVHEQDKAMICVSRTSMSWAKCSNKSIHLILLSAICNFSL